MNRFARQGFTLIELMVTVSVLGVLLAVAAPAFSDLMNKRRVAAAAAELASDLAYARSESVLRNEKTIVRFNSNRNMTCYTVAIWAFLGNCDCTSGAGSACRRLFKEMKTTQLQLPTGVSLAVDDQIRDSFNTVSFDPPLSRSMPGPASVRVIGNRGYQLEVQISAIGRVVTCSPDGSFGGVPKC